MDSNHEVIALLLGEADAFSSSAQRLVRSEDGQISLEAIESQEDFDQTARITGTFRRGKAILDPRTREVMGYEMEEVTDLRAASGM